MIIVLIAVLGLVMGSFASCVSFRLGEKTSLFDRSKCPKCNKVLGVFNLVPLLSWAVQGGKCSNCKAKISWRYPMIELSFLASFLTIYFLSHQRADVHFMLLCAIATTMIIMTIVDLEHYFIPDSLQVVLAILAVALSFVDGGKALLIANLGAAAMYFAFGAALYYLFYFAANAEAIGVDDIKFLAAAGLMLGVSKFLVFILLVGIIGIIFGVIWQKVEKDTTFPFAPALCLSAMINLLIDKNFDITKLIGKILF